MIKKITLFSLLTLLAMLKLNAQSLPVGSIAPDFTLTDVNNVSHNLYNYTDSGYTVIIDISATWCGPCWSVHNSHVFDSLTAHYGANGTLDPGKIKVIFVEADTTTNSADLNGTGSNTLGDWVNGALYPIIDLNTNAFAGLYPHAGYPTFYVVCPNRSIAFTAPGYTAAMLAEPFWVSYMNNCPVKVNGINASLLNATTKKYVCPGTAEPLEVNLQNLGTTPITSATIEALDGSTVIASTNWTGSLNSYDMATVNVGNHTFSALNTNVTYKVIANGDVQSTDDQIDKTAIALKSNYYTVTLQVKTDRFPGEVKWTIKNSSNTVVKTKTYVGNGTNGGGPDASKVFDEILILDPNECYTLEVEDEYGDGLTSVAGIPADSGYIKLYDGLPSSMLMENYGGNYNYGFTTAFRTGTSVSVNDIISTDNFNVFPNPVTDVVNIQFDLTENSPVSLRLLDMNGKVVLNKEIANTNSVNQQMNVKKLSAGIYNLSIVTAKQTKNVKIIVQQ